MNSENAIAPGGLTIQFEEICPETSRPTLQRELRGMVEKNLLLPEGKTNRLYYRLNPLWKNLQQVATNLNSLLSLMLFAIVSEREKFSTGLHLSKECFFYRPNQCQDVVSVVFLQLPHK